VRTREVEKGNRSAGKLHADTSAAVRATAQAGVAKRILPLLSKEEKAVFRRGKNANPGHTAKHSSEEEYRMATGLEALFGFLYLAGEIARLRELFGLAFPEE
jgi:ribonuclease-3 family protein